MSEDTRASLNKSHRVMWYVLVVLAEIAGLTAGFSIHQTGFVFWSLFVVGIVSMALILVLAEALYQLGKRTVKDREQT